MGKFPQAEISNLPESSWDKDLMKSLPITSLYQQLADFSRKHEISPVSMITGGLSDFDTFVDSDWYQCQWAYNLYYKTRLDIKNECFLVQYTENYF